MTALAVPEGLEPLAVWDSREAGWCDEHWRERTEWATAHLDANFTYRAEFYLLDAPFAVVHKFARDGDGRKFAANGEAATEPPAIVPLAALPPAHLLGPACGQCGRTGTASRDVTGTSTLYSWPYDGAERYVCRGSCLETEG